MPISIHCTCGSTFDVPDRYAGQSAHCIGCGAAVGVPDIFDDGADGLIPLAGEDPADVPLLQTEPQLELSAPAAATAETDLDEARLSAKRDPRRDAILPTECTFWQDSGRSFSIFLDPENTAVCLFVWFLHLVWGTLTYAMSGASGAAGGYALIMVPVMFFLKLLIAGVLCSFYLNIILETARGEDRLPPLAIEGSPWDDIFRPLLLFVGSWVAVMLPAVLLVYFGPVNLVTPQLVLIVAGIGVFLWPVTILTVAVGDSLRALRPDLIVATVARTLLPYLAVWAMLAVALGLLFLPKLVGAFGRPGGVPGGGALAGTWVTSVIACVFSGFLLIIIMRILGLYYRHFKDRFAWHAE